MVLGHLASYNEWVPMNELQWTPFIACAGVDHFQPLYSFVHNRVRGLYKFNPNSFKIGDECDSEKFVKSIDPRHVYRNKTSEKQMTIDEKLKNFTNF